MNSKKPVLFKDSDIRLTGSVTLQNGWDAAVEFGMYAENFQAAARAVVRDLAEDDRFAHSISTASSFRAYPAFYPYRHAMELAIKGIIVAGAPLLEYEGEPVNEEVLHRNHGFEKLRPDLERVFKAIGWGWDLGVPGFTSVEHFRKLLAELDEFDSSSAVCRYPVTAGGEPSMPKERCVNLFDFANTMESLLDVLNGIPSIVKHEVDQYFTYLSDIAGE